MSAEWKAAYAKANTALAKLSLQDKVTLATGAFILKLAEIIVIILIQEFNGRKVIAWKHMR